MGGWADAGSAPAAPVVGGGDQTTPVSQQILDGIKKLPADQMAALASLDSVVPVNTLTPDQIKNLGSLNKDELGNLSKLAPAAIKTMLAQDPDAFKQQVQQLDQRGWPGAKDKTAPANGKAWSDPANKTDDKKADDIEKKAEQARARAEAQEKAKQFIEHIRLCNKAQQDALLSAIHMMI
jgi:hypothetical protein